MLSSQRPKPPFGLFTPFSSPCAPPPPAWLLLFCTTQQNASGQSELAPCGWRGSAPSHNMPACLYMEMRSLEAPQGKPWSFQPGAYAWGEPPLEHRDCPRGQTGQQKWKSGGLLLSVPAERESLVSVAAVTTYGGVGAFSLSWVLIALVTLVPHSFEA